MIEGQLENIYAVKFVKIIKSEQVTPDVMRFTFNIKLDHKPGQFVQVYVLGVGEIPISIASRPRENLELCIKKAGKVTSAIFTLKTYDVVGIRGPYGNGFPIEEMYGNDILFVAGGIGIPPLRPVIDFVADNLDKFDKVQLLYGARTPRDIACKDWFERWSNKIDVHMTVDKGDESWKGRVGVVTTLFDEIKVNPEKSYVLIVGPPIMIKFAIKGLIERGFKDNKILTSLERMMKCGVGTCGHCNIGPYYVCKDGPVFRYSQIKDIPEVF
ncbi:MAG: FAD/NAD(P)-binding protein [Candidatus Asgardarchaeia archaeon]